MLSACNLARLSTISSRTCYSSWQAGTGEKVQIHVAEGHDWMPTEKTKMKRAEITAGVT